MDGESPTDMYIVSVCPDVDGVGSPDVCVADAQFASVSSVVEYLMS